MILQFQISLMIQNIWFQKLKKLSAKKISKMMGISAEIADLNHERFANWTKDFTDKNSDVSLLTFKGDVYRGMGADDFNKSEFKYANDHIRILSGLYGGSKAS